MLRNAASKVMWVGRATVFLVGLAVILALVFGVATTAFGANGNPFLLGKSNVATALSKLTGNVNGSAMQVANSNAGADDTALSLSVQAGEAPMRVNSGTKVANLNADRIDDREASSFANGVGGKATNADKLDGLNSSHFAQATTDGSAVHAVSADTAAHADSADSASSAVHAETAGSATHTESADNADKLDGKDSSAFAGTGMSRYTSEVFLDGCSDKVLASSTISPSRPALVYASGASVYDSNNAAISSGELQLELRDATNTTTLASGGFIYVPGDVPDSQGSYHIPLSLQGVLMSGSDAFNSTTPFEVTPGNSYVLRLLGGGTDGTCTGRPVMSNIVLSYVLIGK